MAPARRVALISPALERELEKAGVVDCAVGAERRPESFEDPLEALEGELASHVVAYDESPGDGPEARICEIIEASRLSEAEIERLKGAQAELGATLVAYARPVRLR